MPVTKKTPPIPVTINILIVIYPKVFNFYNINPPHDTWGGIKNLITYFI